MSTKKKKGDSPVKSKAKKAAVETPETINLQPYLLPGVILFSGVLISLGLFFGLKSGGNGSSVSASDCDPTSPLSEACLVSYADELDLDKGDFEGCIADAKYDADITASVDEGSSIGVQGTPSTFLGKRSNDTFSGFPLAGGTEYSMIADVLEYFAGHTVAETREYWKNVQTEDLPAYEQLVRDYFSSVDGGSQTGEELETTTQGYLDQRKAQIESEYTAALVEVDLTNVNVRGDSDVIFLEYSDYECPYCTEFANTTAKQVKENFVDDGKAAFAFADFPLDSIHPSARGAANAARCAGEQDRYFEYHDKLFGVE